MRQTGMQQALNVLQVIFLVSTGSSPACDETPLVLLHGDKDRIEG